MTIMLDVYKILYLYMKRWRKPNYIQPRVKGSVVMTAALKRSNQENNDDTRVGCNKYA